LTQQKMVILDPLKCKPNMPAWSYFKKHQRECGKDCITVTKEGGKAEIKIWDNACAACLNRAKRCPDNAAKVVQLPSNLTHNCSHRYGMNAFKLHGLPMPRPGRVMGILGCNGIGKSTALSILACKLKPNLGCLDGAPSWTEILKHYRGSELQNFFTLMLEDSLKVSLKPQIDQHVASKQKGKIVGDVIAKGDERGIAEEIVSKMELSHVMQRDVSELSGGEMQRLAISLATMKDANVYMFDEASSFLDVRQRLVATRLIRDLANMESSANTRYVIVVEHDLAVLDYMSDYIHVLFGEAGAYGVVAKHAGLRNGINNFLAGYIPAENMKFRAEALSFKVHHTSDSELREMGLGGMESEKKCGWREYPDMTKTLESEGRPSFTLHIEGGSFTDGEVLGLMGENGTGKTTYLEMLAGLHDKLLPTTNDTEEKKYDNCPVSLLGMGITMSYKRQDYAPKYRRYTKSVRELLERNLQIAFTDSLFKLFVMRPMRIEELMDLAVSTLSGGELQRLAIVVCLGTPAMVYLLDEPSAGLDCEQRIITAKVIKRWVVSHLNRTCFVIEHDTLMMSALADRMILFEGVPGVETNARAPSTVADGFNAFLKTLDVTFRRDPVNHRPRVNKAGSVKDRQQKASGEYFRLDGEDDDD